MDELLAALKEATDALQSVEILVEREVNEDAAELRAAYAAAVANLFRSAQAAAALRDARAGVAEPASAIPRRHPDDDGD